MAGTTMLAYGTMNAALNLHHGLLKCILGAPQHFFDTTPKGRILSRFEFDTIDYKLPMHLRQIINVFFRVGAKTNKNYKLIHKFCCDTCENTHSFFCVALMASNLFFDSFQLVFLLVKNTMKVILKMNNFFRYPDHK